MLAIGRITCEGGRFHGEALHSPAVEIEIDGKPIKFFIGNYEEHKQAIDKLMAGLLYGDFVSCAVFEFEPADQFAYYRPMEHLRVEIPEEGRCIGCQQTQIRGKPCKNCGEYVIDHGN